MRHGEVRGGSLRDFPEPSRGGGRWQLGAWEHPPGEATRRPTGDSPAPPRCQGVLLGIAPCPASSRRGGSLLLAGAGRELPPSSTVGPPRVRGDQKSPMRFHPPPPPRGRIQTTPSPAPARGGSSSPLAPATRAEPPPKPPGPILPSGGGRGGGKHERSGFLSGGRRRGHPRSAAVTLPVPTHGTFGDLSTASSCPRPPRLLLPPPPPPRLPRYHFLPVLPSPPLRFATSSRSSSPSSSPEPPPPSPPSSFPSTPFLPGSASPLTQFPPPHHLLLSAPSPHYHSWWVWERGLTPQKMTYCPPGDPPVGRRAAAGPTAGSRRVPPAPPPPAGAATRRPGSSSRALPPPREEAGRRRSGRCGGRRLGCPRRWRGALAAGAGAMGGQPGAPRGIRRLPPGSARNVLAAPPGLRRCRDASAWLRESRWRNRDRLARAFGGSVAAPGAGGGGENREVAATAAAPRRFAAWQPQGERHPRGTHRG